MNEEAHAGDHQQHDGCEWINEEGEIYGKISAENPGPSNDFTNSITGVVDYDVTLPNSEKLIARATVNGTYTPAFISIMPWVQGIPFHAVSDVAYAASEKKPASILLVTDTSGSMGYDDETGSDRQTNLNNAAKDFMADLTSIVAGNETESRILRTGMIPFYSRVWGSAVVDMDWGVISDSDIDYMYAGGGTNTASPMEQAETWMDGEQAFHTTENGYTAQRFVILMTDGANNSTSYDSRTETACTNLKNDGVIVYSIAYALTPGTYDTNSRWGGTYTPSSSELNRARTMLENCASSPDHFLQTTADFDIGEVFESIGVSVVEEVIRIRS